MILKALNKSGWNLFNGKSLPNCTGINISLGSEFSHCTAWWKVRIKVYPDNTHYMNYDAAPAPLWSVLQRKVLNLSHFLKFSQFSFHLSPCCVFTVVSTLRCSLEQCSSDIPMCHHSHQHTLGCVEPAKKHQAAQMLNFPDLPGMLHSNERLGKLLP